MGANDGDEKSLLEKIQDLLERKPGTYDVAFCVGKEKKIVRALKVILKASSPVFEKHFEDEWETAVIKEGEGIPLPDFHPIAFELFVKPNQILNLLSICRHFKIKKAVGNLTILAWKFVQSFDKYKDTDDFLRLSQANLKYFLGSNNIGIKELDVYRCAMRWAEFQCTEMKIEPTEEHIRKVLGDCLFEIRFPSMTNTEFTEASNTINVLTAEESLGIYKFIGLTVSKKSEFDRKKLPFKTIPRKLQLILPGISSLCLTQNLQIAANPPFVCDGSGKCNFIACGKKIDLHGLGFLGSIEDDGFFDIQIHIRGFGTSGLPNWIAKRIFVPKGKTFYFMFDAPITLEAGSLDKWDTYYQINYFMKGPNTSTVIRPYQSISVIQEGDNKFRLQFDTNQIAEVLYKLS